MSFERISDEKGYESVLDEAFKLDSPFIPAVLMIAINPDGNLALLTANGRKSLRFPDGTLRRPNRSVNQNAQDKLIGTVKNRTNATFGRYTRAVCESMGVVPFKMEDRKPVDSFEKTLWPHAIGKLFIPVVVPVEVSAPDPMRKYEILWEDLDSTLATLDGNNRTLRYEPTLRAFEALKVSIPTVYSVTASWCKVARQA